MNKSPMCCRLCRTQPAQPNSITCAACAPAYNAWKLAKRTMRRKVASRRTARAHDATAPVWALTPEVPAHA